MELWPVYSMYSFKLFETNRKYCLHLLQLTMILNMILKRE